MTTADLPALNATLNAISTCFLAAGYVFIRSGNRELHQRCMLAACAVSTLFLASYTTFHWHHGSTPFTGTGWVRTLYFAILIPHVILAALVLPLAIVTVVRAWREDFEKHRRVARITFPIWMYVSVTGVIIYWMVYRLYPPGT